MAVTRLSNSGIKTGVLKYDSSLAGYPGAMPAPTATATGSTTATVAFSTIAGATSYTAISTPGNLTGTGTSSPITVSGLTGSTNYTFRIAATNAVGQGGYSAASNQITTLPPFTSQLAYDSIASTSLGSTTNTITFTGIPQTYAHLELRIFNKVTRSGTSDNLYLNMNGDTGNNYAMTSVARTYSNAPAVAYNTTTQYIVYPDAIPAGNQTDIFGYAVIRLTDYTKTKWKAVDGYWGWCTAFAQAGFANVNGRVGYTTAAWQNTSAITDITITTSAPTFQTNCIFALYGIKSGY